MHSAPENVAIICAPLWDCDAERAIYGVKIYRTSIVKRFPYKNVMSCEIEQLDRIKAAGYEIRLQPLSRRSACLGEHGKHYTPKTIFKRWQRCFQKHHRYGNMAWVEPYARKLLDRYVASGETMHLYAFLGVISGIVGPPPDDREQDWREPNLAYEKIHALLRGRIHNMCKKIGKFAGFASKGFARREIFDHYVIVIPKSYPDSAATSRTKGHVT